MKQHEQDERRPPRDDSKGRVRPMDDPTRGRQGDKLEQELPHPSRDEPGGNPREP